jgi:hypothetical protein
MAAINSTKEDHSLDHMFNASFDKKYQMNAVELVAYDPINVDTDKALKRVTTNALGEYNLNDKTEDATIVYVGFEDAEADWIVQKLDYTSGLSRRFATKLNNPTVTSYADAWAAKDTTLVYSTYGVAF